MKKIWGLLLLSALAVSSKAKPWVHGSIEYTYALPQSNIEYRGEEAGSSMSGVESEIFHNVPYLPNLKFDMFRGDGFSQNNKTLYYSTYYGQLHFDMGATLRDVEYRGDKTSFNLLTVRAGTFASDRVYGGFTYNYEFDGQVKEYLVDVNYIVSKKFPMTLGFQYKSSHMELTEGYDLEGILLKIGFKF